MKDVQEVLKYVRESGEKLISPILPTQVGLRYRNGEYEVLCPTCSVEKWVPVVDRYAEHMAKSFVATP